MSLARARTRTARSWVERTNQEATMPPTLKGWERVGLNSSGVNFTTAYFWHKTAMINHFFISFSAVQIIIIYSFALYFIIAVQAANWWSVRDCNRWMGDAWRGQHTLLCHARSDDWRASVDWKKPWFRNKANVWVGHWSIWTHAHHGLSSATCGFPCNVDSKDSLSGEKAPCQGEKSWVHVAAKLG